MLLLDMKPVFVSSSLFDDALALLFLSVLVRPFYCGCCEDKQRPLTLPQQIPKLLAIDPIVDHEFALAFPIKTYF